MRVLIVDDLEIVLKLLSIFCQRHSIEPTCVKTQSELFKAIKKKKFDLIILDNYFDACEGRLIAKDIKQLTDAVIALSSSEKIDENPDLYWLRPKPITEESFTKLITEVELLRVEKKKHHITPNTNSTPSTP